LSTPFHPPELLRFQAIHFRRQLRRRTKLFEIDNFPAFQLGAITQVEVFRQGIRLPATGILDGLLSPHPGSTIKLEQAIAGLPPKLLYGKMNIQLHSLKAGEYAEIPVDMFPARLNNADIFL